MPSAPLLAALPNFRDLGGSPLAGGRAVRRGLLFRAPVPRDLPPEDAARLTALAPALLIDLRGVAEAAERPAILPDGLAPDRAPHPIEPRTRAHLAQIGQGAPLTHALAHAAMVRSYRSFVEDEAPAFASAARTAMLAAAEGRPVIFHCTAGKDRTGLTAALILSLLGAAREVIVEDYLATNGLWAPHPELRGAVDEAARSALFSVHAEYLEEAFAALDRLHGGAAAFAAKALGGEAEAARVAAALTEPA